MPETRHYCPHCDETVSLSTFHRHKQLYYNEKYHVWTTSGEPLSTDSEDTENDDCEPINTVEGITLLEIASNIPSK